MRSAIPAIKRLKTHTIAVTNRPGASGGLPKQARHVTQPATTKSSTQNAQESVFSIIAHLSAIARFELKMRLIETGNYR